MKLNVNGKAVLVDDAPDTPLLWVIRDTVGLTGTKFGCGVAQCGACTVLVDGEAMRSCSVPVSSVVGKHVTTIEGLAIGDRLNRVQQAWIDAQVPQCGYCQSGIIVATTALLAKHPHPTDQQIADSVSNICRCGTYDRIRVAIKKAVAS
jgi:isoquinoline 1-oxidoreductase alpha subunit